MIILNFLLSTFLFSYIAIDKDIYLIKRFSNKKLIIHSVFRILYFITVAYKLLARFHIG